MSAGYTRVEYGNVAIQHVVTREFFQEPVPDQSGADLLYHRFLIKVSGIVHGHTGDYSLQTTAGATSGGGSATITHRSLTFHFAQHRQRFRMYVGRIDSSTDGEIILEAEPVPADISPEGMKQVYDLNNGPRCKSFRITHVAADEVFHVEAEFEIYKLMCQEGGDNNVQNTSGVLSNRWSYTDEIDNNLFTTRSYEGTLRTFTSRINPNVFRHYVVPPLQPGMRRERMSFTVAEDGLSLRYNVTDRDVTFAAPAPATNWEYSYTESTGDGMGSFGELRIMLEGPRDCNRKELISIAAGMIHAKLVQEPNAPVPQNVVEFLSFTEESGSVSSNRIIGHARVRHVNIKGQGAQNLIAAEMLGVPIDAAQLNNTVADYDPDRSRGGKKGDSPYLEGPISMVGAFAAYLQQPCSTTHKIRESSFMPGTPVAEAGPQVEIEARIVQEIPDEKAEYLSETHAEALYTYWQMESSYEINEGKVALPIMRSSGRSKSGDRPDTTAVVSLHPPTARRIVRIAGERVGKTIALPPAGNYTDANGIKATLLKRKIRPASMSRTSDGQPYFRIDAEYVYALSRAPDEEDQVEVGENPWDVLGVQTMRIGAREERPQPSQFTPLDEAGRAASELPADQA